MRAVSWNCNGALRNKFPVLEKLEADICVVQECENPATTNHVAYQAWASNSLWVGDSRHRGLGVFAKEGISLAVVDLPVDKLELFLPCRVAESINLLAVWTKEANSPTFKYIGQVWKWLQINADFLKVEPSLVIGDFNSNTRWDVWDRWWNHSDVVEQLKSLRLMSVYHHQSSEVQGQESQPTFYMQRKLTKPYHIDYAFLSQAILQNAKLAVGSADQWLSKRPFTANC